MIRFPRPLIAVTFCTLVATRVLAVYAPIPEEEKGRLLTVYVTGGVYYDTNIFGSPDDERSSLVYAVSPRFVFNLSATDQTLVSASYQLSLDHFADRPGKKLLDSHTLSASVKHTFSPRLEAELSDVYLVSKNPESLLPGLSTVLNTDQSYTLNQLDGRLGANLTKRIGLTGKARAASFAYDNDVLPYVELAAKIDYAKGSYLSAGYGFSVEEVSNLDVYTDMSVHRFFANVQHVLTPRLIATGSVSWEPTLLNGRQGVSRDRDETNARMGVALTYRLGASGSVSATVDRDAVKSDDPGRILKRTRAGVSVRWVF
jgi:hypothetical protein